LCSLVTKGKGAGNVELRSLVKVEDINLELLTEGEGHVIAQSLVDLAHSARVRRGMRPSRGFPEAKRAFDGRVSLKFYAT
jgi:hypothetical protein